MYIKRREVSIKLRVGGREKLRRVNEELRKDYGKGEREKGKYREPRPEVEKNSESYYGKFVLFLFLYFNYILLFMQLQLS